MKKIALSICVFLCCSIGINAQNIVKGIVIDNHSENVLPRVLVTVKNTIINTKTNANGGFNITDLSNGNYVVEINLKGYESQNFPIQCKGVLIDLGTISLFKEIIEDQDLSIITITDDELNDDASAADHISGLLQASQDTYLRTAAFDFSASFFRIRGLDAENGKLLINGIEMNKIYSGRPQWSNWGGLNDVLRNQEFSSGLTASSYTFGGVLGATNIDVRPSKQRPGTRISYASSNRSYVHRVMAKYASGMSSKGWAYTFSASKRVAKEGFVAGSLYNANSMFFALEKNINNHHSVSFSSILASNRRGKSAPQTQEVFNLKGNQYNSFWGYQEGVIRNSRIKEVFEPILMLHHDWAIDTNTSLNTNVSYQFGKIGNSRIDNNGTKVDGNLADGNGQPYLVNLGASNPDPTYYQKLPSYALRQGYTDVYQIQQSFLNNGQLNWNNLYNANLRPSNYGYASYVVYEDRNDDTQLTINSILDKQISNNITLNARLQYIKLKSKNYANLLDLLGGTGYLDVDAFATTFDEKQNDLSNPLNLVGVGDLFKYHFNLYTNVIDGFVQGQFKYNKIDFFLAASLFNTTHQREGFFKNGGFPDNSLGKSNKLSFVNYGLKAGTTYKFSGRHLLDVNLGYLTRAPNLKNSFSNARENNNIVENLTNEKLLTTDVSYVYRGSNLQAKLTAYYTKIKDATEISFFFADGIGGDYTAFVQEILSGIDRKHLGAEIGIEAQVTSTIKLKAAGNFGQYTYANNPNLYLTSERKNEGVFDINGRSKNYVAYLKNYKLASGPQKAFSVGFEYRDPDYWFVGATVNFFSDVYIDVAPLTRTSNFADDNGIPFNDYNKTIARELLAQEKFKSYKVVNIIGGKSWRIKNHYLSVFVSIGNLLNTQYKTGGFEQGRNANYRQIKEDKALEVPVFGNKYWFGRGTTYFLNFNYSF